MLSIGPAVGRIGINLQRGVGADELAHSGDVLNIAAGLYLEFDADVSVVDIALHGSKEVVDRIVNADAHSAGNSGARGAEVAGKRRLGGA